MKKIIALAIAVLMLAALAVPAFAADGDDDVNASGTTEVTYSVKNSYTLTIPSTVVVGAAENVAPSLEISNYNVVAAKKIVVTPTSDDGFVLTTTDGDTVGVYTYELNAANYTFTANGTQKVTANWADSVTAPTKAGSYADTVTFTAAIVNAGI